MRLVITYGIVFSSARMLVGATSAVYLASKGLSAENIGWLKALQAFVILATDLPLSLLADRYGRRSAVILSVACASIWLFLTAVGNSFIILAIGEIFNAVSMSLSSGAFVSLMIWNARRIDPDTNLAPLIGRYNALALLGIGVAGVIGANLAPPDSSLVWYLAAGITAGLCALSPLMLHDDGGATRESAKGSSFRSLSGLAVSMMSDVRLLLLLVASLALSVFYQLLIQFWQLLVPQAELERLPGGLGTLFALILAVQSLAGFLVAKLANRSVFIWLSGCTMLAASAGWLAGAAAAHGGTMIALMMIFFSLRIMSVFSAAQAHEAFPDALRATCDSAVSTLGRMLTMVALPVFGATLTGHDASALAMPVALTVAVVAFSILARMAFRSPGQFAPPT